MHDLFGKFKVLLFLPEIKVKIMCINYLRINYILVFFFGLVGLIRCKFTTDNIRQVSKN
jgi:hypothetical protein